MTPQLTLIRAVCGALTCADTKEEMLRRSVTAISEILGIEVARIWTLDEARGELVLRASGGLTTAVDGPHSKVPLDDVELGWIASTRRPRLVEGPGESPSVIDPGWAGERGLRVFAGYPLVVEGHAVGVIGLFASAPLSAETREALPAIADILALGIGRKRAALGRLAAAEELREALAAQAAIASENARLLRDAKRLIAQLEQTNSELDRFAYVASHDLKAPLRGIANLGQWIEDDLGDRITDQVREHIAKLRGRVTRLEGLIDGILQYSRIGRTRTAPEAIDLQRLIKEVVELLAPPPHVTVVLAPGLPQLTAERVLLSQVFMNLIGNAVKYGHPDRVRITVGAIDRDEAWELYVEDDGPGIPPEQHERIWGVFQTLNPRDRVESTGIGLAIVKKIVSGKGGRAWVESEAGRGATFRFTWPKAT